MKEVREKEFFERKWHTHLPMRNALISGLITGTAFVLAHLGLIPSIAEKSLKEMVPASSDAQCLNFWIIDAQLFYEL
jgi:hypothetical protein